MLIVCISFLQLCTSFSSIGLLTHRKVLVADTVRVQQNRFCLRPTTRPSLRAFSSDASEVSSNGQELDVEARVIKDDTQDVMNAKDLELQFKLLTAVAGLDRYIRKQPDDISCAYLRAYLLRGAAAGEVERDSVLRCVEALERSNPQPLEAFPAGLSALDGLWRLIYSSALSPGRFFGM